jgi:hypothetical protein
MHGGAAGSGAPLGNRNALKHGLYTAESLARRRLVNRILRDGARLLRRIGKGSGDPVRPPDHTRRHQSCRLSLSALFEGVQAGSQSLRNRCIRQAHLRHGYTLTEIGAYLGLHYSTVSKVVNEERRR